MKQHHEDTLSEERRREVGTEAVEHVPGPNPVVGLRVQDLFQTASTLVKQAVKQPHLVLAHGLTFAAEAARIAGGSSRLAPDGKDSRFQDPTWRENQVYRRALQVYLAANNELHDWVGAIFLDEDERRRAHFVLSLLSDALAPSNSMLNPEALKRFLETGGTSAVRGLYHLLGDLRHNGGMPSQVDTDAFKVGKNLAATPGSVVFRNEVLELIHYQPVTENVSERPLLMVPPQINKFYVFDLSPKKSLVQYALSNGLQVFMISWRNPTPAQREFILSTSGHIQSILNPPGNAKATFFTNAGQPADAQAWYAGATRHSGSWWEHWKAWLSARSGSQKAAPPSVGNSTYIPLVEAPGTYVYE